MPFKSFFVSITFLITLTSNTKYLSNEKQTIIFILMFATIVCAQQNVGFRTATISPPAHPHHTTMQAQAHNTSPHNNTIPSLNPVPCH